jgi:hypothetical protein
MPKALLSCCLLCCFVVSASAQRQSVTPQLTTALTVIPPAVATSQQLVDIRLGLANPELLSRVVYGGLTRRFVPLGAHP